MVELLIAASIIILGSALASGTEAALFSVPIIRVRQLAESNVPGASALLSIKEKMSRPISTIVIFNNIFNIVGSIIVGGMAANVLGGDQLLVGAFSALLTLAVIIGAEIIPKNLGERYSEPISLFVARPVASLTVVMFPLVWLIERIVAPITRGPTRMSTNEAEIKLLAQIGQQEGSIESDEAQLIQRVFRLNDMTARSLMTPRVSLTYLHMDKTLAECREQIINSQHSRILVIGESIDDVQGIVLRSHMLQALVEGQPEKTVAQLARPARFVPELVRADKLLEIFRESHEHLAVVVDEFGGIAGVVSLEDVLEVLTGEIVDETDRVIDMQARARRRLERLLAQQTHPTTPADTAEETYPQSDNTPPR